MAVALQKGDDSVLADILRSKGPIVEQALRSRFPILSAADLEDVLSKALFYLWTNRTRYKPEKSKIGTWFYLLARNVAIDSLRAHRRRERTNEEALAELSHVGNAANFETSGELTSEHRDLGSRSAVYETIQEILNSLEELDRQIILAYVESGSGQEFSEALARELGISPGNLRTKRSRILKRIREELAQKGFSLGTNVEGTDL